MVASFVALMAGLFSAARADNYPQRPVQLVGSNISSADQESALCEHISSVRVTHLDTASAMLGMLRPKAGAEQILNFAAEHDGLVCREAASLRQIVDLADP